MEVVLYVVLALVAAYFIYRYATRAKVAETAGYSVGGSSNEPRNTNTRYY